VTFISVFDQLEFAMGPVEHAKWLQRLAEVEAGQRDRRKAVPRQVTPANYTRTEWREKQRVLRRVQMR